MTDLVIKGTGNSRYLKSVADFLTQYPTYEDFVDALVAGTLPIDFNGINSAGIQTQGTPLNKANLLKDTTASKYGQGSNATVDSVLNQIPSGTFPNMSVGSATNATNAGTADNATNATNTDFTNASWTVKAIGTAEEIIVTSTATFEVQLKDEDDKWIAAPLLTVTADVMTFDCVCLKSITQYCYVHYSQETSSLEIQSSGTWTPTAWRYRIIR